MAQLRLFQSAGKPADLVYPVPPAGAVLGRAGGSGEPGLIDVPDPAVSRRHAQVERSARSTRVRDLSSRFGTFVNSVRITEAELRDGDVVRVGETLLRYEQGAAMKVEFSAEPAGTAAKSVVSPITIDTYSGREASQAPVLLRFARKLNSLVDREALLEAVLDLALAEVPAKRGYVVLLGPDGAYQPMAVRNPKAAGVVQMSRTVVSTMLERRAAVLMTSAGNQGVSASMVAHNIQSVMCAPMWKGEAIIGFVHLDTDDPVQLFRRDQADLMMALAFQASLALERADALSELQRQRRAQNYLCRYVEDQVAAEIIAGREGSLDPREIEATALFADIQGFTRLCEHRTPSEVAAFLNQYLTSATEVVLHHGGMVDKYVGDAVMAVFGAPMPQPDHASAAVRAGLALQNEVTRLCQQVKDFPAIRIRVGIATGRVLAGNIGSARRMEYTVLGDAVNVASRLEGAAPPGQVWVNDATAACLSSEFQFHSVGAVELRNHAPVETFQVDRVG